MLKTLALCAAFLLSLCYSADAVLYTYKGATNTYWNTAADWDNGSGASRNFPNSNADCALINTAVNVRLPASTAGTITVGELRMTAGTLSLWTTGQITGPNTPYYFICSAAGGQSGDFYSLGGTTYQSNVAFSVDGNFNVTGAATFATTSTLALYGTNKGFLMSDTSGYALNAVDVYGSYQDCGSNYSQGGHVDLLHVHSTGSITGGNWGVHRMTVDSGGQLAAGNFYFVGLAGDNLLTPSVAKLLLPGNARATFPGNVDLGSQYHNRAKTGGYYTWKMDCNTGDLSVRGFLEIGYDQGFLGNLGNSQTYVLDLHDNGTNACRSATVLNYLQVGGQNATYPGILRAGAGVSTIKVGGNLLVGQNGGSWNRTSSVPNGALDLGNATVVVGGDYGISRSSTRATTDFIYQNWSAGTSTLIFDGNATKPGQRTQTIYSDNMPLNNLIVRTRGTVVLSNSSRDTLYLTGNLLIDNGTFTGNKQSITFNGPNHTFTNNVSPGTYQFDDNINLLANSVLALGSDITIKSGDNLNMAAGSVIYLSGHVLKDEGRTYDGSLYGMVWTNTEGSGTTIYALSNVPEPATLATLGSASLAAIAWLRRRRTR